MNDWQALDRFLQTDPRDVGCAEAMEMLHVYPSPRIPRHNSTPRASRRT